MDKETLKQIVEKHLKWLLNENGGERASLNGADLSGANLSYADLNGADLSGASLRGASLSCANLSCANLNGADLSGADLSGASLSGANMSYAELRGADLSGAELSRTNLSGAELRGANLSGARNLIYQICPEEGEFIGWKKVNEGFVLKLIIPKDAGRISIIGHRKCRAEFAIPIEAIFLGKEVTEQKQFHAKHRNDFVYTIGEKAIPDKFDNDPRIECSNGISFFITKQEAIDY